MAVCSFSDAGPASTSDGCHEVPGDDFLEVGDVAELHALGQARQRDRGPVSGGNALISARV